MVHASASPSRPSLDGTRIAANAGAIAFNGALLLLLLVPLSAPDWVAINTREDGPVIDFKPLEKKPEPVPVDMSKPVPTIRVTIDAKPQPQRVAQQPVNEPVVQQTASMPSEIVVDPMPSDTAMPSGELFAKAEFPDTGPLTGARLAYAHAPAPPYPVDALREGRSGTVILEVLVGLDGKPLKVTVAQSSGQRDLDRLAVRHVESKWRFEPATRNGQPVQAIGRVPIQFSLD